MIAGIILAWSGVKAGPAPPNSLSAVKLVLFRTETYAPSSAELKRLKVFLLCGNIELDLRSSVTRGASRNAFMIEITACAGRVNIVTLPDVEIIDHKAFVMRLTRRIQAGFLDEKQMRNADVVAATLAFFGDVGVTKMTMDGRLITEPNAPDTRPGPENPSPTTK